MPNPNNEGRVRDIAKEFRDEFNAVDLPKTLNENSAAALQFVVRGDEFRYFFKDYDNLKEVAEKTIFKAVKDGRQQAIFYLLTRTPADLKTMDIERATELVGLAAETMESLLKLEKVAMDSGEAFVALVGTNSRFANIFLNNRADFIFKDEVIMERAVSAARNAKDKLPN